MRENKWNVKVDVVFVVLGARHGSGRERVLERQVAILFFIFCATRFCVASVVTASQRPRPSRVFSQQIARDREPPSIVLFQTKRESLHQRKWQRQKKTLKGKLLFFVALSQASRMRGPVFRHTPHIVCFLVSNIAHSSRFRTCSLSVQRLAPNWGFCDGGKASKTDDVDRSQRRQVFARRAASPTRLANTLNNCRVNL